MPELNIDRILNENPVKVLIREYEELKKDYTKMNSLKYKALYESQSLSFILENSRYIFGEPMYGCDFYKNIMESHLIPFDMLKNEYDKVSEYVESYSNKMSNDQKSSVNELLQCVTEKWEGMKNSCRLYSAMMENAEDSRKYYDALYEQKTTGKDNSELLFSLLEEKDNTNIMDTINIMMEFPEMSRELLEYVESMYVEDASTVEDYKLNSFTTNILGRMMQDKFISERVNSIRNVNLCHTIMGLAGVDGTDMISNITEEVVHESTSYENMSGVDILAAVYEEAVSDTEVKYENVKEKIDVLLRERAVMEMDRGFLIMDLDSSDTDSAGRNSIVEKLCIESSDIEKIPYTISGQIELLSEAINNIDNELYTLTESLNSDEMYAEKYFGAGGSMGKIVAGEVPRGLRDGIGGGHVSSSDGDGETSPS